MKRDIPYGFLFFLVIIVILVVVIATTGARTRSQIQLEATQKLASDYANAQPLNLSFEESTMAKLADEVYNETDRAENIDGYTYDPSVSTLYHALYTKDNDAIIAIRGTKLDLRDLASDISIVRSREILDERFLEEEAFYLEMRKKYNVKLTGHSLGGGIVNFLTHKYGVEGYAWNAGGRLSMQMMINFAKCTDGENKCDHVKNYRILGDPVSNFAVFGGPTRVFFASKPNVHAMSNFLESTTTKKSKLFSVNPATTNNKNKRLVISVDGGGVRGGIAASFLECMEREFFGNQKISTKASALGGVSAGAMIASMSASGKNMSEVMTLFRPETFKKMFVPTNCAKVPLVGKLCQQYLGEPKLEMCKKYLGEEETFENLQCKLMIPTYNWTLQSFCLFHNFHPSGNPQVNLADVVHASSSPPYYFPCVKIDIPSPYKKEDNDFDYGKIPGVHYPQSGDCHCDGGIAANTPDITLYALCKKEWPDDDILVLSIGTGYPSADDENHKTYDSNIVGILQSNMFRAIQSASQELNSALSALLIPSTNYLRVQKPLPPDVNPSTDYIEESNMKILQSLGKQWFEDYRKDLEIFLAPFI